MKNQKIVLARYPDGEPSAEDFKLVEEDLPELEDGQVLLAAEHLSIDAFIRTMLNPEAGHHGNINIETPVTALGVGRVVQSRFDGLNQGDAVFGPMGAQTHLVAPGNMLRKLDPEVPAQSYLGALGMTTGITAYAGMLKVAQPQEGETVLVSAAAGAVGSIACQLAKNAGARVVGIAGGAAKCDYLTNTIGCDGAVDYKAPDVAEALREQAPGGVNVYFDNVGGELLDVVLDQIVPGARVVICGAISQYNHMDSIRGPSYYLRLAERNSSMLGFTVDRFAAEFGEMEADLAGWLREGKVVMPEHVVEGIEHFPEALMMLFNGGHMGKLLVKP